jgi:hypothetical protein
MPRDTKGPDFLGIGPPKTATSWMYAALAQHPDVTLPPIKELGYLWARAFLPDTRYLSRFTSKHWYFRTRRYQVRARFRRHTGSLFRGRLDSPALLWDLRYALLPHTDAWYSRLFDERRLSGDITPKYCELPDPHILRIRDAYPHIRIVISVRDPVEREWSRAKMNLCAKRGRRPEDVSDAEWIAHFDSPIQAAANDYLSLYRRWTARFGEDAVHLFFFDDVVNEPRETLEALCRFLGLSSPPEAVMRDIERPRNAGLTAPVPDHLRSYLFEKHREKMTSFAEGLPMFHHPRRWLERYAKRPTDPKVR